MPRRGKVIRFPRVPAEPTSEDGLVEVYRCDHNEALVVRGLLESAEIAIFFRSRIAQSVHPFSVGSQGEIIVMVPEAEAARARSILGRIASGPSFP
jgi:putative signal transducing protein